MPKELVKDFKIELIKDGNVVAEKNIADNYQRLFRTHFENVECDTIKVTILKTNGSEQVRVFEIRVYE